MYYLCRLRRAKAAFGESIGKVAIGTVKGDLHDIGKKLVAMMLEGSGFEINAPLTETYAQKIGADGYATDASSAVRKAHELAGV